MSKKIKILFLAAEPTDLFRLQLGKECERIKREIELEVNRDRFEVVEHWAVTTSELIRALRKHQPDIVHFSGHGGKSGIILEDGSGDSHSVPKEGLAELFEMFRNNVRLVFLNACYSEAQVQAFTQTIDFTIGMRKPVGDSAAISFAAAFYGGLSFGYSVEQAYRMANILLKLDRLPDQNNPRLFTRRGVDGSRSFLDHIPVPQLTKKWRGAKGLRSSKGKRTDEPQVGLWIHGWVKRLYDCLPTVELDWTEYFRRDTRKVPSQQAWNLSLFKDLQKAKKELDKHSQGAFIDFRGKLPLTALLAVGATFPEVGGYSLRAEQPTRGKTVLWRSDAGSSKRGFKILVAKQRKGSRKQDILIALSITGSARDEVVALYNQYPETFSTLIYAEPNDGTGDGSLRSDKDAMALAIHAKELIRECKRDYQASQVHLVVHGPGAYCLFLGQRLNALGTLITYERALNGSYRRSVTLHTG
ncbi:MAG TPA: SAVED domain-containing protein [Blastocatellia bacterium]|nr:SAVED domain-containing protein [Blastocatellia bacterium]